MKNKWGLIVFISIVVITVFIFLNKLYSPPLPIDSITPKEVMKKISESNREVVEISKGNDVTWYISKNSGEVNKNIEHFISSNGWIFEKIEGSSLFFKKKGEMLIVSTEMWTTKYRLIKVPSHFEND